MDTAEFLNALQLGLDWRTEYHRDRSFRIITSQGNPTRQTQFGLKFLC
jgi:hypothetical protein